MAFLNSLLAPSTWRLIGLGTTTLLFGLGSWPLVSPFSAADALGIPNPSTKESQDITRKAMMFLGMRDLAAAAMLAWFHRHDQQREMGVLLLAWLPVVVVDTLVAMQGPRGFDGGIWGLWFGGVVIAFVGAGLAQM